MIDKLDDLNSNYEKAEYLQSIVIARATGGEANDEHYKEVRKEFLDDFNYKNLLPIFIKHSRNLEQFWQFIKGNMEHMLREDITFGRNLSHYLMFLS